MVETLAVLSCNDVCLQDLYTLPSVGDLWHIQWLLSFVMSVYVISLRVNCLIVMCWQTARKLLWTQSSGTESTEEKRPTIRHSRTRPHSQIVRDRYTNTCMLNCTNGFHLLAHASWQVYTNVCTLCVLATACVLSTSLCTERRSKDGRKGMAKQDMGSRGRPQGE